MMKMTVGYDGDDVTDDGDDGDVIENDGNIMTMAIPRMEDDEQHSRR